MALPHLSRSQLDTLTAVCGFGLTHAATALSQLMGKPVRTEVPRLRLVAPEGIEDLFRSRTGAVLRLQILGNLQGSIVIVLPEENARHALEILLGARPAPGEPYGELEVSTLLEIGNILASACLNALGARLKMALLPSLPQMDCGDAAILLSRALPPSGEDGAILMIDTDFSIADAPCSGTMFLMPASASLEVLLAPLTTE